MITTLYQIDLITASGMLRLLNSGDEVSEEIAVRLQQETNRYAPIGAKWGETVAKGGAIVDVAWARVKNHASHAALRGYCLSHAAAMPYGETGTLRLTITGGGVWEIADGALVSCEPMALLPSAQFETLTAYAFTGGEITAGVPIPPNTWPSYDNEWQSISANWETF